VLVALVVATPATFLIVRAQLFSLALFPVLLLLLRAEARAPSRRIWLAVPLLALWANLHGGVLLGLAVVAAYLVLDRPRSTPVTALAALALSGAALLATPAGLRTINYYASVLHGEAAAGHYGLWAPLSLREPLDLLFVAIAVPLVVAAFRGRMRLWELATLAGLAWLSVEAQRNGIWLLVFAAVPAAAAFGRSAAMPVVRRSVALVCACIPLAMVVVGLTRSPAAPGAGTALVDEAVHRAHGTPILADPVDAEQLAARGARIWIGNPLEAFSQEEQRAYIAWLQGRAPADRRVRIVLVARDSAPQRRLTHDSRFRELARDASSVLYGRV
jgi:hypothetical protein